jgi:hypothetical protein
MRTGPLPTGAKVAIFRRRASPHWDCERIGPERRRRAGRALPPGAAHARLGCRFGCATWVAGSHPLPELAAQRRRQLAQADHDLC